MVTLPPLHPPKETAGASFAPTATADWPATNAEACGLIVELVYAVPAPILLTKKQL